MKITIEARIDALSRPSGALSTSPADIVQWDRSEGWRTTWARNDLQVGGMLELTIAPVEGGPPIHFKTKYIRIDPMRIIEWQTDAGQHVSVMFSQIAESVVVHQRVEDEPTPSEAEQREDCLARTKGPTQKRCYSAPSSTAGWNFTGWDAK